ncbi:MAG: DsbA family protein [Bacteroidales bacterium]
MKRLVAALALAIALGVAAYFLLPRLRPATPPAQAPAAVQPETLTGDALRQFEAWYQAQPRFLVPISSDGAAVLIVKFTDYQCPGCAWTHTVYAPVLARWQAQHPGAVKLVSKQYPLDTECNPTVVRTLHPAACEAAIAVLLAGQQRAVMEDWLYAHHESLTTAAVEQAAATVGHVAIHARPARTAALNEVQNDAQVGRMLGVSSTPTFFVNGVKLLRDGKLLQPAEFDAAIAYEMRRASPPVSQR